MSKYKNFDELDNDIIKIIKHYGVNNQKIKAIEELSELQKELCKSFIEKNKDKVTEEMADCILMLYQLSLIYNNMSETSNIIQQKIKRTLNRIKKEKK